MLQTLRRAGGSLVMTVPKSFVEQNQLRDTKGAVRCHQFESLDWRGRKAKFKESVPTMIIDEVAARIEAIQFE